MVRVFIGAYPPDAWARRGAECAGRIGLPPRARAAPPEMIHLTMQFVGDVDPRDMERLVESVRGAASGVAPFDLTPDRIIALPERGPARVAAIACAPCPAAEELHRRLASRLAHRPRSRDRDRFLPHLTIARFDPTRWAPDPESAGAASDLGTFEVRAVRVMRSDLLSGGARHTEVRAVELGGT